MNKKRGELLILATVILSLVLILILGAVSIQYFQINNTLTDIKSNLFYICQNAVIACGSELELEVYDIDSVKLQSIVYELLSKSYLENREDITSIKINELYIIQNEGECMRHTDGIYKTPFIHIEIEVEFRPVLKLDNLPKRKVNIHQDVKLSLMVY